MIVGQQYKILSELGAGGMGIVYHGVDVMLEREVAIKKLRSEFSRTPDIAERFRRDPQVTRALLTIGVQRGAVEGLTRRERQVLVALCQGSANKQIARLLGISEKTVKAHLTNIFARVGVADRTQAVLWAQRHGLDTDSGVPL